MSFLDNINAAVRRKIHQREIDESLRHFEHHTGHEAETKQTFADMGTFRSQVDRLFSLGNAAETAEAKKIAESTIGSTLTNRYYRAADYLSDVLDELERHSYLTGEPLGEPPLPSLSERFERELKLKAVTEAWLVPLKVGAIESSVTRHAKIIGRLLPYAALQRYERAVARLFALADESEQTLIRDHLESLLERWRHAEPVRTRFPEPADAVNDAIACLNGESTPDGISYVRARRADAAVRLSTVVPEDRQHYLNASLARWNVEP